MGTRTAAVPAALTVALLLAGCDEPATEPSPAPLTTTDSAGRTTVITPSPPAAGDAGPTTAVGIPLVAVTLGDLRLGVPRGWNVAERAVPADPQPPPGTPPDLWCLQPPDPGPLVDGCGGVLVALGGDWLPGPGGTAYEPGQASGWTMGPVVQPCPFPGEEPDGDDAALTTAPDLAGATATPDPDVVDVVLPSVEGEPLTSVRTELDGRPAVWETWRVACSRSGVVFAPQAWYVPELELLVRDHLGHPETVLVLASLEASDGAG